MNSKVSRQTRTELTAALRERYCQAPRKEKARILDEFVAVAGYHRKHAVRVLGGRVQAEAGGDHQAGQRIYDEAVVEALTVAWGAADRICGKRLRAVLPSLVAAMERHGHLDLDPLVRERLLRVSAATIDRLLTRTKKAARDRRRRSAAKKASKKIPVRTFADWNQPVPGYLEIDFVAHCGGSMAGTFIHSLVATDVCSGWTEAVPLLAREQSLVVEGLEVIRRQLPIPLLGIDSDNDGAFINDTLVEYCSRRQLEFTRSRPYCKNDQAWIEQKNGAVIRRLTGYERFSGPVAGQALAQLYGSARLYVNYFQPSFKLREKWRDGASVRKRYHAPATPCERLCARDDVDPATKETLRSNSESLDPIALLHQVREAQAALGALVSPETASGPGRLSLEQFLAQLPQAWNAGEVRPTHRKRPTTPRTWRTREDPFATVWPQVLAWLQDDPDTTAKALFERLDKTRPGQFESGQLRTLQRRVKEWRAIMARSLVHVCVADQDTDQVVAVGRKTPEPPGEPTGLTFRGNNGGAGAFPGAGGVR